MALGAAGAMPGVESLLFLLVQTGIGAGLVLDGRIPRGLGGWAGEVGHIPVPAAQDAPCICGSRGCVALIAANPGLMRAISTAERPVTSVETMRDLVLSRDLDAITTLRQAGRHLGKAITGLVDADAHRRGPGSRPLRHSRCRDTRAEQHPEHGAAGVSVRSACLWNGFSTTTTVGRKRATFPSRSSRRGAGPLPRSSGRHRDYRFQPKGAPRPVPVPRTRGDESSLTCADGL